MRKYFLISAVALLATSTAFATTDYAEVTAKATIEVAGTFECSDLNFGKIVVKQKNKDITLALYDTEFEHEGIISWTGSDYAHCNNISPDPSLSGETGANVPETITLKGSTSNATLTLKPDISYELQELMVGGWLTIPENVTADTYIGSFTLTYTY
ncbi:MAG: DUF4402 domain-containing protein [Alphaproteobacteria bacterium]|nr:DUF4402 domain-containing protein [Alphaproteobacteria bacterium]